MMQIQSLTTPTSSLQPMTLTTSPKIPFPQFSLLSRVWNITSLGFLLDCVPTKLCAHPWPICYGEQSGERTCCSAVAKTPVCCQRCCGHKSKTQHPLQNMNSMAATPRAPTPFTWHQPTFCAYQVAGMGGFCHLCQPALYICLINCPFFQLFSEILYCLCFSPFCF